MKKKSFACERWVIFNMKDKEWVIVCGLNYSINLHNYLNLFFFYTHSFERKIQYALDNKRRCYVLNDYKNNDDF